MSRGRVAGVAGTEIIRFATGRCTLGAVLVASSDRGICCILIGDDADLLSGDLRERFAKATIVRADIELAPALAAVIQGIERPAPRLELPLDLRGTAFQQRVWQALRDLPAGMTTTYTQLARQLGKPRAVRAVAGACAANPIAVAVPCHRVVRRDGHLAGYRWGIERKAELLRREKASGQPGGRRSRAIADAQQAKVTTGRRACAEVSEPG